MSAESTGPGPTDLDPKNHNNATTPSENTPTLPLPDSKEDVSPISSSADSTELKETRETPAADNGEVEVTREGENKGESVDAGPSTEKNALERVPSQAARLGKKKIIIIMGALCLALFLAALDMTIISTALPTIASHFHANESGYVWMASSYLLANSACVPFWGKISDIFGRKPILLAANLIFLIGSLICGLAVNLGMLLVGRAIQGIGGGGIIVLGNICVGDLFSPRDRPVYYGLFGATWAIASALGPIIGGALTQKVTWRWCFYINLPVGGLSFIILLLFLSIEAPKTPLLAGLRAIDWMGTVTIVGGTVMFLFGLEYGGVTFPWDSATVICLIVFGLVVMALFFLNEWKLAKYPIIPVRIFSNSANLILFGVSFCHAMVFIAGSYFLPLYFQTVLEATPILSGVYLFPQIITLSVTSAITGVVIKKTGRYVEPIQFGMFMLTLGFGLMIDLKPYASWPRIIIYQLIAGTGVGPNFQSPLIALQSNVRPSDVATATATFGFIRQLSTSMSVVLGGVVNQNFIRKEFPRLSASLGPELAQKIVSSFSGSNKSLLDQLTDDQRRVVHESYTYALSRAWIFYTCIGGFGLILSLFVRKRELSKHHQVTKTGLEEQERARLEMKEEEKQKREAQSGAQKEQV